MAADLEDMAIPGVRCTYVHHVAHPSQQVFTEIPGNPLNKRQKYFAVSCGYTAYNCVQKLLKCEFLPLKLHPCRRIVWMSMRVPRVVCASSVRAKRCSKPRCN